MKKILFSLFFLLSFSTVYASTSTAHSYILMDATTGRVLDGKNYNEPMLIASTTKIMTCLLAIESNKLDDLVTVDDSILSSSGSGIYIEVGEELTLRDLLYGLMLRSGNDAALMIANYISNSTEDFVKLMNKKALEIGMKNTTFRNPSGLDDDGGNISTSYDMALLTKYAMKYKEYRTIVKTKKYTLKTNKKTYIWYNKNKLLNESYITGGKTGYTIKAKRTLVSTASKNNINLIVVTLRDSDDWNTHKYLYKKAFNEYTAYKVLDKNNYNILSNKYYIKHDVYIPLKQNETSNIINHIKLNKKKTSVVGTNNIYLNNKLIYKENIYLK